MLLRAFAEPVNTIYLSILSIWLPGAVLIGYAAEAGAGIIFAIGLWRRVKPHWVL